MGIRDMYVTVGKVFSKIYLPSQTNDIVITIKNTEKNVIDLETTFKPTSRNMADYFIQVESKINSRGEFYHDSNGYLVIKRNVGIRPDYTWHYKTEDKINANTYPMCSFAYGIEGDKKVSISLCSWLSLRIELKASHNSTTPTSSISTDWLEMITRELDRASTNRSKIPSIIRSVLSTRTSSLRESGKENSISL